VSVLLGCGLTFESTEAKHIAGRSSLFWLALSRGVHVVLVEGPDDSETVLGGTFPYGVIHNYVVLTVNIDDNGQWYVLPKHGYPGQLRIR